MHVPLFCCEQVDRQSLLQHGQAEIGTTNNMGNWKGSRQNVDAQDMVILKHRSGEAKCLTDPERNLAMTLHSIWPCDSTQTLSVHTEGPGDLQGLWRVSVLQSPGKVLSTTENDIL